MPMSVRAPAADAAPAAPVAAQNVRAPTLQVRFMRRWTVYMAGDCVNLPPHQAREVVRLGLAEPIGPTRASTGMVIK